MLKQLIPVCVKDAVKVILGKARALPVDPNSPRKFCPVCQHDVEYQPLSFSYVRPLLTSGYPYSLFDIETMNFEEYMCRNCGASDRERLYALYFNRFWRGPGSILEIAPGVAFTAFLRRIPGATVRTADLFMANADDKVDLTNMSIYSANQFDTWICSHVLEHVPDDLQAMRELFRVLKPGGWGIAMVPIVSAVQTTHEDATITDPTERWRKFGQYDHVRMYSKSDFVGRLESVGFEVVQFSAGEFGEEECSAAAIDPKSVLYIAKKRA